MNIDKYLDKAIKILVSMIICIMLIIGLLFVTPVYVHADTAPALVPVTNSQPDYATISNIGLLCGESSYYNGNVYVISSGNQHVYCGVGTNTIYLASDTAFSGWYTRPKWSTSNSYTFNSPSWNSDYNLYFTSMGVELSSQSAPVYSNYTDFLYAVQNTINAPVGEFYSLPQVNASTEIDYTTVAAQGANIYVDDPVNVYSFLGQYETTLSPTSQYCYVQTGEDAYIPVVFSSVPLTVYRAFINGQTMSSMVCSQYDTGKYYAIFNHFATLDMISPIVPFESLSAAQEAFEGASSGGGAGSASGVVTAGAFTYDVPSGNVLYVRVRAGSLASVTVDMKRLSGTSSPYWSEAEINTLWASGVSSLPNSTTTFPLSGMTRINFMPDSSKGLDGYGRSNFGIAQHAPLNGGWLVVYNPAYAGSQSMYGGLAGRTDLLQVNPTVTVHCQYAIEYYSYPLSESLTVNGGTSTSNDQYENPFSGQVDDTGTMQRTDDREDEPVTGGEQSNVITENNMSLSDYLRNIEQVLSDFANSFITLLTAPISHINRLITAGSAFMASISQFFTWLPEPVLTVITSALVVAVVIGVIKLLF